MKMRLPVDGLHAYERAQADRMQAVAKSAHGAQGDAALRQAATDFEALLIQRMWDAARRTVPQGGFLSKSHAEQIYEGMLDEALSTSMAHAGGLGLASLLLSQLAAGRSGLAPTRNP